MKREDIDAMEAKARAALESLPEAVQQTRWATHDGRYVTAPMPEGSAFKYAEIVRRSIASGTAALLEHIAASDPHAVLALIAELRRVEEERDVYAEAIRQRNRQDAAFLKAISTPTERIPYSGAGMDLLEKTVRESGAPSSDGFVDDAADQKPDDT